jgi:aryl-alcohol dehydrogenase-like predicted oxidoreductase
LRLGFGCSGALGQRWHPAAAAEGVLRAAVDGGIRHFDTASVYGDGEAERRLGKALKSVRDRVFVSTKTGTRPLAFRRAARDFSAAAIRRDVEQSLRRLDRDRLDLLYLHGPSPEEELRGLEAIARLKEQGKVALAGVCAAGEGLARAVEAEGVDAVMATYNFLRREHGAAFARAKARGIGVVAIAPLAQGLYSRDLFAPRGLADGWRLARALVRNRRELARARSARPLLESGEWTPAQLALGFVLANPSIDAALTTTTKPAHLAEILAAARYPPPPAAIARIARLDDVNPGA